MSASVDVCHAWSRIVLTVVLSLAACKSDSFKPKPVPEPSDVYWDLLLDKHAVTLSTTAPYDTVTVRATPRNYLGEPLSVVPRVQFASSDPKVVTVTADGVLVAGSAADKVVTVTATLTAGNLKHADTLHVRVVDDPLPPVLETFSVQPVPPDTAKWYAAPAMDQLYAHDINTVIRATYVGGVPVPTVSMTDPFGIETIQIPDMLVSLRVSDTTVARFFEDIEGPSGPLHLVRYRLVGVQRGDVDIYASLTYFGVTKEDTLHFRIGYPLEQTVELMRAAADSSFIAFRQPSVIVGTGGVVVWRDFVPAGTIRVTFDDPTNVHSFSEAAFYSPAFFSFLCNFYYTFLGDGCATSGNFMSKPTVFGTSAVARSFPVPGVYEYRSDGGKTGRVVVGDD